MDKPRILIVDDEPSVLHALKRLLRSDFDVTVTDSPEQSVQLLKTNDYAILIADQCMPEMEGTQVLEQARAVAPHTIRIMLTGHADVNVATKAVNQGAVYQFLTKPWNSAELIGVLRQAIQIYNLEQENRRLQALTHEQGLRLEAFNATLTKKVFVRTRQLTEQNRTLAGHLESTVALLARLAEAHSQVLGGHARRVATLAATMGRRMHLAEDQVYQLEQGALLHDVGKIGMDPQLLNRAGYTDDPDARNAFLAHAPTGAARVRSLPGLQEAAHYIRHYQEHFDGSGYPDGLRGEAIPLGARIIAVADAFDANLNRRDTFGQATAEDALEHIRQGSLHRFDPNVVTTLSYCVLTEDALGSWAEEVELPLEDVQPGMVLARDVHTPGDGVLATTGTVIGRQHLTRLSDAYPDAFTGGIRVRRQLMPSVSAS